MTKAQYKRENSLTLTVPEAARELGISSYLAWSLVRKGELPSIKLGKLVRVPRAKLLKVLEDDEDERN